MNQQQSGNNKRGRRQRGETTNARPGEEGASTEKSSEFVEKVVHINRCAKVVKGGRRFSFSALVVIGDQKGRFGIGHGKAKEVPDAILKATQDAKKNLETVQLKNNTIPHPIVGKSDGGVVVLRPASPGTGVIAGAVVKAIAEVIGIQDILTKSQGSNNPHAMVNATVAGLRKLRTAEQIAAIKSA